MQDMAKRVRFSPQTSSDKNKSLTAEERFREIHEPYKVLADKEKQDQYSIKDPNSIFSSKIVDDGHAAMTGPTGTSHSQSLIVYPSSKRKKWQRDEPTQQDLGVKGANISPKSTDVNVSRCPNGATMNFEFYVENCSHNNQ